MHRVKSEFFLPRKRNNEIQLHSFDITQILIMKKDEKQNINIIISSWFCTKENRWKNCFFAAKSLYSLRSLCHFSCLLFFCLFVFDEHIHFLSLAYCFLRPLLERYSILRQSEQKSKNERQSILLAVVFHTAKIMLPHSFYVYAPNTFYGRWMQFIWCLCEYSQVIDIASKNECGLPRMSQRSNVEEWVNKWEYYERIGGCCIV